MGYVAYGSGTIKIPVEDQDDAYRAGMTALADADLSWSTSNDDLLDVLVVAFDQTDRADTYSGSPDEFLVAHTDKYHDDEAHAVYDAIAPFVTEGVVDYTGEEETHWRVRFRNGTWSEHNGEIVYPTDDK